MSYLSPAKKGALPVNQSYTVYSPIATTTLRKPNAPNSNISTVTVSNSQVLGSPSKVQEPVEAIINERNNYKQSFHQSELDLAKARAEINALQDQIDFYKAKALASPTKSVYQKELDRTASSPLRSSMGPNGDRSVKEEALELELSRLRKQLIEKNLLVEEWMKRATRAEVLAKGDVNLPEELALKMAEIDRLNRELTQLELKTQDIGRLEREISDLKALNQFKEEENERLRREKTAVQLENYKTKQSELSLKDQEIKLSCQVKALEGELTTTQKEAEAIQKVKDHLHQEKVKEIENVAALEKNMLQRDLNNVEGLLINKEQQLSETAQQKAEIDRKLLLSQVEARQNEQTANVWRERAGSAEKEVQYVQQKSVQDQEALRNQLRREQSIERQVLQDKIKTLQTIVTRKEDELSNTQLSLADTNQKKREVELAKLRLQGAVDDLEKRNTEMQKAHSLQMQVTRDVHNKDIQNLKSSHDFEKQRLNQNINNLVYVADKTKEERDRERLNAANYQNQYLRSAEKQRNAENSAQFWQDHSRHVERQRSNDMIAADNLRRSQIDTLNRSHSKQMEQKAMEQQGLLNLVANKDSQIRNLGVENSIVRSQVVDQGRQLANSQVEANVWKNKYADEQQQRSVDNLVNQDLRRSQEIRHGIEQDAQRLAHTRDVHALNNIVDLKADEADQWRNNYHRVLRNNY